MKFSYLIILFSLTNFSFAQTIEQIRSDSDAIAFLRTNFPALDSFRYAVSSGSDTSENRKWDVSDLDKNSKPDLLITGTMDGLRNMAYVILAEADNNYKLIDVTPGGYFLIPVSVIKKIGNDHVIILKQSVGTKVWSDTLTHKFGVFLKYNSSVQARKISLFHYRSTGCLGTCPVYKLIIDSSNATLEAEAYIVNSDDTLRGTYYSKLAPETFNKLTELVNYIDLSSLKTFYSVSMTDQPSGIIEIVFTDGSFKRIDDYGKSRDAGTESASWISR